MGSSSGLISGLPDLTTILNGIGTVLTAMSGQSGVIANLAGLVGVFFIFQSLTRAYEINKAGSGGAPNGRGAGGYLGSPFIFGILLLNFWAAQQSFTDTLQLSGGVLAPNMPAPYLQQMWSALKVVLNGFGYIAVFRGILLLKGAGDGSGSNNHSSPLWAGFWHILGGALLINL